MEIRCSECDGAGEIEMCAGCHKIVDNCECETSEAPDSYFEECDACDGTGEEEEAEEEEEGA